jgi:hypothetical protein
MIEGGLFTLRQEEGEQCSGFYTTRFVAAATPEEAAARAKRLILGDWQGLSLMSKLTGTESPSLSVVECEVVEGWFRLKSAIGYVFFPDDSAAPEAGSERKDAPAEGG